MDEETTLRDVTRRYRTSTRRRRDKDETRRGDKMLEGAPALPAELPDVSLHATLFPHRFSDLVFYGFVLDFGSHLGSILASFSVIFACLFPASILHRFSTDC